jgi:carboxylate-amine ligase
MTVLGPAPRFGVEEEFLVVDPVSRNVMPGAGAVISRAKARLGDRVSGELTHLQVETRTDACTSVAQLIGQLTEARAVVGDCAAAEGLRIVATGTPVLAGAVPPPITQGARQDRGNATYRGLHDELAICALHVHVEIPDRDLAVQVSNNLRPYLPVLITLVTNSPFWSGRDTQYESWRTMIWPRWPVAGPPPLFRSAAHYDEVVETMLSANAIVDRGTIFWDIRPSATHPTLEIRVADVPITAAESAMFATVVRALVVHAADEVVRGVQAPVIPGELMRMAYWRAARDGLAGDGFDLRTGRLAPAAALAGRLFATVHPILESSGDWDLFRRWADDLFTGGTGAGRQRAAAARRGVPADVVDYLIAHTAP